MADTLFGKIIRREIPADIVYEDDEVLAFRDINPQAPTHVLFIPKKPIATLNDLTEDDAILIGKLAFRAARWAKQQGFAEDGYRVVMNCNAHGGQTVYHIHLHLLGGRPMHWPPG
jgi:histidine triad (HIT) family protein